MVSIRFFIARLSKKPELYILSMYIYMITITFSVEVTITIIKEMNFEMVEETADCKCVLL